VGAHRRPRAAIYRLVTGHAAAAGTPALVAGGALAAALVFFCLVAAMRAAGRDQVALLHSWVAERLQSPGQGEGR
jgi:hypothetical protein